MNNTPEDIIILQMCTINDSHMMYGSLDMKCNWQNSLSFWTSFCSFTPLTTQKIKILKNWEIPGDIIIWHTCIIKDNHIMYSSWDMKRDGQMFLSFWTVILPFYSPNNPKNENFEKMKQKSGDIIILQMCILNDNHMMYASWDMKRDGHNFLSFWTCFAILPP